MNLDCININLIIDCLFEKYELMTKERWNNEVLCEGIKLYDPSAYRGGLMLLITTQTEHFTDHDSFSESFFHYLASGHTQHDFSEIPLLR